MKRNPVLANYIFVLRCYFYTSQRIKDLFSRLYEASLGGDTAYRKLWDLGKALTDQNIPLDPEMLEPSGNAEVDFVLTAFLPLTSRPSAQSVAAVACALGLEFKPEDWAEAFDERGRALGIRHLKDHSDYSISLLCPRAEEARAEWRKRYPALYWGCAPKRGSRPAGVKGWAWATHIRAWGEADFA